MKKYKITYDYPWGYNVKQRFLLLFWVCAVFNEQDLPYRFGNIIEAKNAVAALEKTGKEVKE